MAAWAMKGIPAHLSLCTYSKGGSCSPGNTSRLDQVKGLCPKAGGQGWETHRLVMKMTTVH